MSQDHTFCFRKDSSVKANKPLDLMGAAAALLLIVLLLEAFR